MLMSATQKLTQAGFTLIRKDYERMAIKTVSDKRECSHGWKNLETGFKTKAELDRRLNKLLEDQKTIEY